MAWSKNVDAANAAIKKMSTKIRLHHSGLFREHLKIVEDQERTNNKTVTVKGNETED